VQTFILYRALWLFVQKARSDKETALLQNKLGKLESLCRALQEERKKATGVTSPSQYRLCSFKELVAVVGLQRRE